MQKTIHWIMRSVGIVLLSCSAGAWAGTADILIDPFANTAAEATTMLPTDAAVSTASPTVRSPVRETISVATPSTDAPAAREAAGVTSAVPAAAATGPWDLPWLRAFVAFLFVASLIVVVGTIARRLLHNGSGFLGKRALPVRVVQTLPLGSKRTMYVVDFEGTQLLIGAAGSQLQLLHAKPTTIAETIIPPRARPTAAATNGRAHAAMTGTMSATAVAPEARNAVMELSRPLTTSTDTPMPSTNGDAIVSETPVERADAAIHVSGLSAQIRSVVQSLRPIGVRTASSSNGSTI
ncbi:MAG: flagellar biosynthetic protein FliO [Deltaproteobacteria bacterium]|nr:flagellar biosynthetic protein FliO [Deltaproteobacteria bacterium]